MPVLPFINVDPSLLGTATSFLFVFAVVFGLLSFAKLFVQKDKEGEPKGKEPRMIYAIIALVFAVVAISYQPLVDFVQQILPPAVILLIIIFFFAFLKEIFRKKKRDEQEKHPLQTLAILAILLVLLGAFWNDITRITGVAAFVSPDNLFVLIGVIIIVMLFYTVSKMKEPETK